MNKKLLVDKTFALAVQNQQKNNLHEAKNLYEELLKTDKNHVVAYNNLGIVFKKLGELGLMGVLVPTEYGGSGFSYTEYVTAIEQLSILDPSIGLSMAAHNSLCIGHILYFGNEEQKKRFETGKTLNQDL